MFVSHGHFLLLYFLILENFPLLPTFSFGKVFQNIGDWPVVWKERGFDNYAVVSFQILTIVVSCQFSKIQFNLEGEETSSTALLVKAHWEGEIGITELYLSFYPHPNISDWFRSHFICIQIFQIDFHLILYLVDKMNTSQSTQ